MCVTKSERTNERANESDVYILDYHRRVITTHTTYAVAGKWTSIVLSLVVCMYVCPRISYTTKTYTVDKKDTNCSVPYKI